MEVGRGVKCPDRNATEVLAYDKIHLISQPHQKCKGSGFFSKHIWMNELSQIIPEVLKLMHAFQFLDGAVRNVSFHGLLFLFLGDSWYEAQFSLLGLAALVM